jgi:hypothetical protein
MNVGMLWLDEDRGNTLSARVGQAAEYYSRKYGTRPNTCVVHPKTFNGEELVGPQGMSVRSSTTVLPGHFWLGVEERGNKSVS